MHKLYLVMVGLPARGKSRLARRICGGLAADGFRSAIFNNGDVRRELLGAESTLPEFYSPDNAEGRRIREEICRQNLIRAKEWLNREGDVAILDATNVSRARRAFIERTLTDHPVLFLECVNEDPVLLNACIRNKTRLPEYAGYTEDEALASFVGRIGYYEAIYEPVGKEQYWLCVDTMSSRILAEQPCEGSPYYPAIREIVVSWWVQSLYLARHGQTEYNVQGRIGGDPPLTAKGRMQAEALALHLRDQKLDWVFTSTRMRSHETAAPLLRGRHETRVMAFKEFDEIWAGDCEGMCYSEIRETMPEITAGRNADKYHYAYPHGESYAMLRERVRRGLQRALFLAGELPVMLVGHQAINRVLLSLFLRQREEDIPYINVPQNQYYHISLTPRRKLIERPRRSLFFHISPQGTGLVPVACAGCRDAAGETWVGTALCMARSRKTFPARLHTVPARHGQRQLSPRPPGRMTWPLALGAAVLVGRGHHALEQGLQGVLLVLRQRAGHRGVPAPDDLQHVRVHVQGLLRREDGGRTLVLRVDLTPDEAVLLQMGQGTGDVALVDVDDVRQLVLGQAGLAADVQDEKILAAAETVRSKTLVQVHEVMPVGQRDPLIGQFHNSSRKMM